MEKKVSGHQQPFQRMERLHQIESDHRVQRIRDYNTRYIQYENSIINKLSEPSNQYTDECADDYEDPMLNTQSGYCVRVLVKIEPRSAPGNPLGENFVKRTLKS